MEIATIGFTKSSAEHFFGRLQAAGVQRLVDLRLRNTSQLAGFARGPDLAYFLDRLCGISYEHDLRLAPTPQMLDAVQRQGQPRAEYAEAFGALMRGRDVPAILDRAAYERQKTVLLCSEAVAEECHRRVVAELMAEHWGASIEHL